MIILSRLPPTMTAQQRTLTNGNEQNIKSPQLSQVKACKAGGQYCFIFLQDHAVSYQIARRRLREQYDFLLCPLFPVMHPEV